MEIIWKGSPNFSGRSGPIRKIVIHWFGLGTLESANIRFQNPNNQVSAHYGISRGRVWQWVREKNVAWHSGVYATNNESIGIEHDAVVNSHVLSEQDYDVSGQVVASICRRWNIPCNRQNIIAHSQVKATQCPGTINLDRIIAIANKYLSQKGEHMTFFKVKGKTALYELTHESWRGYDDLQSYSKDTAGKDIKIIELDEEQFNKLPQLYPI